MSHKVQILLSFFALFIIAGCTQSIVSEQVAMRLASPAWMVQRQIPAGPFALTAFERMHERHTTANIYIEGDGFELSLPNAGQTPTPINPVALHLATRDKADNVAYLARPCQFSGMLDREAKCDSKYWTDSRYSQTVIAAYNAALNEIRNRYDIEGFNLIGYSGGGGIATILAAQRNDITSLRTVAGNLDIMAYTTHHNVMPLSDSLNPADFASKLKDLPQAHYIGGQDDYIVPSNLEGYLQKIGNTRCVTYDLIQEAEHHEGWVEKWPELLAATPQCKGPSAPPPTFIEYQRQIPIFRPRDPCLEKGGKCLK
ncbi:alpha/beta hydrolase [Alphaproteobacteria bacterium]|nr:alpha/beta hydrolase [Alphaproteobacteria bacterium]